MQKNGQLASDSHDGSVFSLLAASSSEVKAPLSKGRVLSSWSEDVVGTLGQKTSQVDVAGLGDGPRQLRPSVSDVIGTLF
jgi:hypothetical protein